MHPTQKPASPAPDGLTPADLLRGAALYLQRHGWTQGAYYQAATVELFPPACASGALALAAYGRLVDCPHDDHTDPQWPDFDAAWRYLQDYLFLNVYPIAADLDVSIIDWNDEPSQDKATVVATLTAAADDYDRTHRYLTTYQAKLTASGGAQ